MRTNHDLFQELENIVIPAQVHQNFEATLSSLPDKRLRKQVLGKLIAFFALMLGVGTAFLAANPAIAANIPFIGKLFQQVQSTAVYAGEYDTVAYAFERSEDTVKMDQGLTISAAEGYCDGYSMFITFELKADEPIFGNMPKVTSQQAVDGDSIDTDYIYMDYAWKLSDMTEVQTSWSRVDGYVSDAYTFVSMLKVDMGDYLDKSLPSGNTLTLTLHNISYDDLDNGDREDLMPNTIHGTWEFILPIDIDNKATKLIPVEKKNDAGFGIEKVLISPYQVVVYAYVPFTVLTEEEVGTEADFINEKLSPAQAAQADVHALYEQYRQELLMAKEYEYAEIVMFNGNGELFVPDSNDRYAYAFPVQNKNTQQLHIFLATEFGAIVRASDIESAKEKSAFYVEIDGQ
jgi:hypothetical protein